MEEVPNTEFPDSTNPSNGKSGYTVLVPLQDIDLSKTLLPPAIRAAKRHNGKIILLNVIEIPYQLPPSEAEQFKLEREFKLQYARQILETSGCDGEIMVRIAHQLPNAIERLSECLDIDLIIMWAKNNGLLWDTEIYQKLYAVNSNLLVAKEKVESHFDELILCIDDLHTVSSMMEHANYLLGSEEGTIHLILNFTENDEGPTLKKVKTIMNRFHQENPWFTGKTIINQLQSKFTAREFLNEVHHKETGSICMLVSYPPGKKSRSDKWLGKEGKELNIPVFISKIGQVVPMGIDEITNKLKNWVGIIS